MLQYSTDIVWPQRASRACAGSLPAQAPCALVASLSRWHMRWFLALCERQKYCVESYRDTPIGSLESDGWKQLTLTQVVLRPQVRFAGTRQPDTTSILDIHAAALAQCVLFGGVEIVLCRSEPQLGWLPGVFAALAPAAGWRRDVLRPVCKCPVQQMATL